jgi:flagellar hook-associated protein 2
MRVGGLASGMDTDALVKELMQAKRLPLDKLSQEKIRTEWQRDSYREFNLSLSKLRSTASDLRLQSSFNAYNATSSNVSSLTASTTANALNGTYQVEVVNVASTAKIHSASAIKKIDMGTLTSVNAKSSNQIGTAGTITVKDKNGGAISGPIQITSDMTYADVAKKLQDSTAGKSTELRASFDDTTSRFFMSTKGLGDVQNFTMEFSDSTLANQVINNSGQLSYSTSTTGTNYMTTAVHGEVKFDGILVDIDSNKQLSTV